MQLVAIGCYLIEYSFHAALLNSLVVRVRLASYRSGSTSIVFAYHGITIAWDDRCV